MPDDQRIETRHDRARCTRIALEQGGGEQIMNEMADGRDRFAIVAALDASPLRKCSRFTPAFHPVASSETQNHPMFQRLGDAVLSSIATLRHGAHHGFHFDDPVEPWHPFSWLSANA